MSPFIYDFPSESKRKKNGKFFSSRKLSSQGASPRLGQFSRLWPSQEVTFCCAAFFATAISGQNGHSVMSYFLFEVCYGLLRVFSAMGRIAIVPLSDKIRLSWDKLRLDMVIKNAYGMYGAAFQAVTRL